MMFVDYLLWLSISVVILWSIAFISLIHVQETIWLLYLSILFVLTVEFVVINDGLLSQLRVIFMLGLGLERILIYIVSRSAVENLTNVSVSLIVIALWKIRKKDDKSKGINKSSSGLRVHRDFMLGQKEQKQRRIY